MEKKYNNLTIFKNIKGGKPMYKDGAPITNNKGEYVLIPEFNGVLKIEQPLPVGEYEINLREKVARSGTTYYWGGIKKKKIINLIKIIIINKKLMAIKENQQ